MCLQKRKTTFGVLLVILVGVASLSACRRASEEEPTAPVVVATPQPEEIAYPHGHPLDLPQTNELIGITLASAPAGLVTTYNDQGLIALAEEPRPAVRYTFEADLPNSPSRSPADRSSFELLLAKLDSGTLLDSGSIETALGTASWAHGEFYQEDQTFSDLRIFAPHPSGSGTLILYSVVPTEAATVEERLQTMQALLGGIS